MTLRSFTERQRTLLRSLRALVAERAEREEELINRRVQGTAEADGVYRRAAKHASKVHEGARLAAEESHAHRLAEIAARYDALLADARTTRDRECAAFAAATADIAARAKREHDEAVWLAETVAESGEERAASAYTARAAALDEKRAAMRDARAEAAALLADHGHRIALRPPEGAQEAENLPLDRAIEQLAEAMRGLQRRLDLPWLGGARIAVVSLLAGIAAAAVHAWQRPGTDIESLATTGGIATAVPALLLLALRLRARRRVPEAAGAVAAALVAAERACAVEAKAATEARDRALKAVAEDRDQQTASADAALAAARAEVERRQRVEEPALASRLAGAITTLEREHRGALDDAEAARRNARIAADAARNAQLAAATAEQRRILDELATWEESEVSDLARRWNDGLADLGAEAAALASDDVAAPPFWNGTSWMLPVPPDVAPTAIRFGELAVDPSQLEGGPPEDERLPAAEPFAAPAMLDLLARGSLCVRGGPEHREASLALLRAVMLRLLATFPPGKVRFTIIDPVGLGQSFAGFMHLADHQEALVSSRIWTEARHIEQKLADLTEHMETVIQKYLRNQYRGIHEYNDRAGEVAEPFRFLVIADFPTNFTEASARRLASILTSGPRCGVYALIAADARARAPAWLPVDEIESSSVVVTWRDGRPEWRDEDFGRWPLRLDAPPDDQQLTRLVNEIGALARDSTRVRVPFAAVEPPDSQLWSLRADDEVRVPVGRAGATKLQLFALGGGTRQHALIAGRTGSGKSTLLHVLITTLGLWYSPDEVEFYLVDFKKGVEFKTYAAHRIPHARVVAIESEREFGLSVLQRLDAELTRRGDLFRAAGVQDIAAYRATSPKEPLPRTLLIIDEFQEFFVADDRIAQDAALLLDRLVRQGRAFGMHVVLGSQTLGGAYSIARATIGQMAVRVALQCSEADSYLILSEDNAAARLLSRPGEAIYNDASGLVEGNNPFQIVWLPESKRDEALEAIARRAAQLGLGDREPVVFEGNRPADLAHHPLLARSAIGRNVERPTIWLGDPVTIKAPTAVVLERRSGSNLLIVGQQDESTTALLLSAGLALAAPGPWRAADAEPTLYLLDGWTTDDAPGELTTLLSRLPVRLVAGGPRDAARVIEALAAELERREQHAADAAPAILSVAGLHRFRELRRGDDFSFSMTDGAESHAATFARLVREGPSRGLHTVLWCDAPTTLDRFLERSTLREFDARLLFQMSAANSTGLIDGPQAATLGRHRALLYSEESNRLEKFRPYAELDRAWLDDALGRLAGDPAARQ